jgi:S1-C subfamily serine protease
VIDLILLAVVVSYAISGYRQGLAVGALSLGGFLVGALVAMTIVPPMAEGLDEGIQRSFVVLVCVLLFAWLGQLGGAVLGARLRQHLTVRPAQVADHVLGLVAGVVAVLLVLWFVGGALRGSPAPNVNRAVSSSKVLAAVDRFMPGDLDNLAENFRRAVAGTQFPRVFAGVAPEQILPVPSPDRNAISAEVVGRAERSIVKIMGDAEQCGRGQEGSGVVVGPQRVATNAHVVAGVSAPTVQVGGVGPKLSARVVLFDPERDLAVLAVPELTAPALPLAAGDLGHGDDAVVAGFPHNGPLLATAARVRAVLQATGEDIYGKAGVQRGVYSLYAKVEPGNSGGPLISGDGKLAGIVFAKSLDDSATGYALTISEVKGDIGAGGCTSG